MSNKRYASYSDLTNPALKDDIKQNCLSTIQLAALVAEFAKEMATAYETFAEEIQKIVVAFRTKHQQLKTDRVVDTPSTIYNAWENLIKETEMDAQSHLDSAGLLIKNVCEPLKEVALHKNSQAQKLLAFRDNFEEFLHQSENKFQETEQMYMDSYGTFKNCGSLDNRESLRHDFHNMHNDYLLQIRASNRIIDEFQVAIPQILEELDEIYIDTSNTVNVAIESHSLLLLTKANEQQRRLESILKFCRQVNPQLDINFFVKSVNSDETSIILQRHRFCPADHLVNSAEESIMNHLLIDHFTELMLRERRAALQREALELTSFIKQNQDITHTLVNICQRNLANHLYAKVYETQEDMCRKRNEIRVANMQLGAVRAQSGNQSNAEDTERRSRVYSGDSHMANTELVYISDGIIDRSSNYHSDTEGQSDNSEHKQGTSVSRQTSVNGLSAIRETLQGRDFSEQTTEIIMASWRCSTKKQYGSYIKKWFQYSDKRKTDCIQTNVNIVLGFLTELFESGNGYSSLNTARSALSAIGIVQDGFSIGSHPLIIRFMKGVFNLRPSRPRYNETWDVSTVLHYLRKLSPVKDLCLKLLSFKLTMLIALTLASRSQSIHLLCLKDMRKNFDSYVMTYKDLLKQSRSGKSNPVAIMKAYPPDRRLCVFFVLKEYLKRTQLLRQKNCDSLFISYVKPHKAITKTTISRWLRNVLFNAGIDCNKFKPHSIRSAAVSKATANFVPIGHILQVAGWSNTKTFGKFYNKPVETVVEFDKAVLRL